MEKLIKLHILFRIIFSSVRIGFECWKRDIYNQDLDSYVCCDGHDCGCDGITIREYYQNRKHKPIL